jgi:predicted alpha/beta-hydrolase family hydrolase
LPYSPHPDVDSFASTVANYPMSITWEVSVDDDATVAVYEPALAGQDAESGAIGQDGAESSAVFICAHGAGGYRDDASMTRLARALRSRGLGVVRFNFLYREKGSRRIDPMPRLLACISAVAERARAELAPRRLLLGGRSMGGRAASQLVAGGYACDGLILCAYPLHPAGKPDQLRDAHLPTIGVPVLCLSGTRDPLCTRELMEPTLAKLGARWTMHWLDGADHSFRVLKSSGRSDDEVMREVGEATERWLAALEG